MYVIVMQDVAYRGLMPVAAGPRLDALAADQVGDFTPAIS